MRTKLWLELSAFVALAAVVALLPRFVSDFRARELAIVGMYFIALLGLSVLTGFNGQISLGNGAFMAIGGYTTAILSVDGFYGHQVRDLWTIPIAGVVAGIAGLVVGLPALRLSGLYLALITFGIAVSFPQLPKEFDHFFGGTTGKILNLAKPPFGLSTTTNNWIYYLTWGIALVLLVAAWLLVRGKTGRAFKAIRDSEVAAVSSGISLGRYKTLAFGISAFYAGVAGSLYAIANAYVNPDVFPIILSVYLVVGLAVGGLDSLFGMIAGAALIYFLQNHADTVARWLNHLPALSLDPQKPGIPSVVFGIVLIVVMVPSPDRRRRPGATALWAANNSAIHSVLGEQVGVRVFVVCAAVAVMAAASAGARPVATPGVSSDEIHIGSSVPLSGEAAIAGNVARGIDAYFKYVNDKGGVLGRKLKYTYLDDGYDPGRAVNNTIRLIQQEQVFAVFSSLGTNNNLAVRKLLNDAKVPQLYVSSGATTFGRDYKKYPWTIGYIPPYSEEGEIYGRYVVKNIKKAKIAVLYQNDDYGRDLLAGHEARARREGEVDRRERRLRPDVLGRSAAGDPAEGLEGERADGLRLRQVLAPGVQRRVAARLEAADLRQRRVVGSRR